MLWHIDRNACERLVNSRRRTLNSACFGNSRNRELLPGELWMRVFTRIDLALVCVALVLQGCGWGLHR